MHLLNIKICWDYKHMTKPLSTPNFKLCSTQNGNMQCFSFIQSTNTKCKVNNNSCSYTYAYKFCTSVRWPGHCHKNSVCSKHEKLRHWCHCIALPLINQYSNIFTLKTANIHEEIAYENLLFKNNSLGPLLFLLAAQVQAVFLNGTRCTYCQHGQSMWKQ